MSHKLELLAPAGTIEVFESAVQSGADAIYIGAPHANARALAKHFSYEDIAAMVSFAHNKGVKVYVAMNSLVKNEELIDVVNSLSIFEGIGVDAIILQDLGIYAIARKFFPKLRLHASTLLGAHNSVGVKKMAEMGFARIVLAREMSLSEIKAAGLVTHAELEVFVHGAMCFSYSGLCLASSFLGGKSGLRGRCVQPCRRKYNWKGKHKGSPTGYFFSMNDLSGIGMLDAIKDTGVNSIKIEGRMRSLQYIENVVKAYRLVIDNDSSADSLETAQEYLDRAMGRKTSTGFFSLPDQKDIITYHHSGNIGLFMGRVSHVHGDKASLTLQENIKVGDRIRIHSEGSGERKSFTVKELWLDDSSAISASKKAKVTLLLPCLVRVNDSLYKVDTASSRTIAAQASQIKAQNFGKTVAREKNRKRITKIVEEINSSIRTKNKPLLRNKSTFQHYKKHLTRVKSPRHKIEPKNLQPELPLYLKVDSFNKIRKLPHKHFFTRILILLSPETLIQFKKSGLHGLLKKDVTWALPPVIHEDNLRFYREAIGFLESKGFSNWQLGHFSQVDMFKHDDLVNRTKSYENRSKKKKTKNVIPQRNVRQTLHAGYTVNVLNTYALETLSYLGFRSAQISIEADQQTLFSIAAIGPLEKGLTVYGYPALLTARASLDVFKTNAALISPKGEAFWLNESNGLTQVISQQPFSLLDFLGEIKELGVDYGVVDLTNAGPSRDPFAEISGRISGKHRHRKLSSFNYKGSLF